MKYLGSKNRISKYILPIILKNRKKDQWYVEPFAGGMNLIDKVDGKRIANDNNKYLIEMWKGLIKNKDRPYTISRDLYNKARNEYNKKTNNYFDDFMIGWIGWMGSYNGKFFDGGYSGHNVNNRDYISEQIKNTEKQIKLLKDVVFLNKDYKKIFIPYKSIIYCDIPYQNKTQYKTSKNFNYDEFWNWCRNKTNDGHYIYISEYNAPSDFISIWEKKITNSLNTNKTYRPVEKLFIYKNKL